MNDASTAGRLSAIDAVPGVVCIGLSLMALLVLPHLPPERLIVDRWRYYVISAVGTLVSWLVVGYLVIQFAGGRRPLMVVLTLTGMTMFPLASWPFVDWLNARFDQTSETSGAFEVSGFAHHGRTGVIGVRFRATNASLPEIEAEKGTSFFPKAPLIEGAIFRGGCHLGALRIRWLSTLRPVPLTVPLPVRAERSE